MSFEVASNEKSVARVKLEIPAEPFQKAVQEVFEKSKHRFNIPGFRRGKAPRNIIEARYGKEVFFEDALDLALPDIFQKALEESGFETVAPPVIVAIDKIGADGAVVDIELSLKPEFELGDYAGIKIGPMDAGVDEEETARLLEVERDKNSRLVPLEDGEIASGDILSLNFEGFIDGEPFQGGKGEKYPLTVGSGTFIPGFEEQLIGMRKGERKRVMVTFPENYASDELAGKDAEFNVEIVEARRKELPELDDDFALDLGHDSLEALKESLVSKRSATLSGALRRQAEDTIMNTLVGAHDIDLAPRQVAERAKAMKDDYDRRLEESGIDTEAFYRTYATDPDNGSSFIASTFLTSAQNSIKRELIIQGLCKREGLTASPEEIEAEYATLAADYNMEVGELKSSANEMFASFVENSVIQRKLFDKMIQAADTSPVEPAPSVQEQAPDGEADGVPVVPEEDLPGDADGGAEA